MNKAYFHLPGLFEFYELYRRFLAEYTQHREYFYDWCEIGSIYGAPSDCLWGGGRVGFGDADVQDVIRLLGKYRIPGRLTLSNSLVREEHLSDRRANALCRAFENTGDVQNGIILHSDLLLEYLSERYPNFYFVSSTTKVITDFTELKSELNRSEFRYVVPDFRLNKDFERLETLTQPEKDKAEFLCNECCDFMCRERKACYENVSRKSLGEDCPDHICASPHAHDGYSFSRAMKQPGFIGTDDIQNIYLPMGFSQFKIEGRSLGSAMVFEFLLYYMVKPEHRLELRERIYLDSMLDLF